MSSTRLGAWDIGCIVVGGIVGVGIFFSPSVVAQRVDGPGLALTAWAVGGAIALCGALVFAELAARRPGHGGMYLFVREGFGRDAAFVYGWTNGFVIQAGAQGVIGLVMAGNLDLLLHGSAEASPPGARIAAALSAIVALTLLNARGLAVGRRIQWALTAAKLVGVFGLAALALVGGSAESAPPADAAGAGAGSPWPGLAGALLAVLFAYGGWQHGSFVAGAARRPGRDVPLGIVGGVIVVVSAYLAVNLGVLELLGFEGTRQSGAAVAADAARAGLTPFGLGDLAARLLAAAVVVSSLGVLNTICLAPPYVLFAMAREGLLPRAFTRVSTTHGAPTLCILVQGFWGAGLLGVTSLALGGDPRAVLGFLLDGVVFADWIFYGLCGLALLRLRRRPDATDGFRAPGGGVVAVLFVVAALTVGVAALVANPAASAAGVLALALALGWCVQRAGWLTGSALETDVRG